MNEVVNKLLLAGDKYLPEIHLKQPWFTDNACGSFTKNKEWIQKFKETRDTNYIYKNELHKACFQHDIVFGDFKDLARRTASDKVLRNKAFNIAKNPTCLAWSIIATSHLGLIWVETSRTTLRQHHDVATGTWKGGIYRRRLCDVSLVRRFNQPIWDVATTYNWYLCETYQFNTL